MNKPFLCRIGLHKKYLNLPKVGGDLGEISFACKRCGYGLRYFAGKWDIEPSQVQREVREQAQIEYGRVLGFLRGVDSAHAMQMAYDTIKDKFTPEELKPIADNLKHMEEVRERIKQA